MSGRVASLSMADDADRLGGQHRSGLRRAAVQAPFQRQPFAPSLVLGWMLDVIDDEDISRAFIDALAWTFLRT
jgi:hypothetical protein